ncbi:MULTISPECIES: hypothetical protein [unclassified Aureispira]|uniref:hypothetical protein n=1 Tax=unclassified Aureispira TaxID=2649989 RepID=UPI0012DC6C1C|nr:MULTISPECIES: hypothetical protein [unclassified Aureispira]WMX13363.1 hypothetical protein QP953_21185 [Aureispira sp. CCB-E]
MRLFILLLLLSCSYQNTLLGQLSSLNKEGHKRIQDFIKKASGVYNNKAQADTTQNPLLRLSEIRAFRIWTHKKNDYWMSIGWYQPNFPEQPMGEKIFHIKSFENDTLWVDCYSWKEPNNKKLLLQWKEKHPYKKQQLDDLMNDGCGNYIVKNKDGSYELKTIENQICAFDNPMAPFDGLFFHFVFDAKGTQMDIYDKNYKGKNVIFHYMDAPMLMRQTASINKF